jgi:hypothetical protein
LTSVGKTLSLVGTGTVDGAEPVRFLASAVAGSSGSAKFRLELWDRATGTLVYDSQPGAPIDAAPTTPIRGGTVSLHIEHSHKNPKQGIKR